MKGRIYENKGGYVVRFGAKISKWFKEKEAAERFLNGIRYETDKGTFDERDYRKDRPLAFNTLTDKYLEIKQSTLKRKSYNNLKNYLGKASEAWGSTNIKAIDYAMIEDFLYDQKEIADKTRANMKSCLHDFFTWLRKRCVITAAQMPEFPEVKFELGWRQIIDMDTQQAIINEVHRISYHINPKIWIGIKWLSVYIAMRPGELLNLQEKYVDLKLGALTIPHPKEREAKVIPLLEDDIEILKNIPRGLPDLYFFRHPQGISGAEPGSRFGQRYLWKWWKKAIKNLKIEGVDLYGGTRHSTASALGDVLTPEQIKAGTMHATNKAFERYFQAKKRLARPVYEAVYTPQQNSTNLQNTYNIPSGKKVSNILKIK